MAAKTKTSYRATFLLDTRGVEASVDSLYEEITQVLTQLGGEVTKVANHGARQLTRVSHNSKQDTGIFVQYDFTASGEVPVKVHEKFRLDNRVDRIMIEKI